MALILNKSITGITSTEVVYDPITITGVTETIISGTTVNEITETIENVQNTLYTTGFTNLNYIDIYGNIIDDPYMVVDNFVIDKNKYFLKIKVNIYKDKASRTNNYSPLKTDVLILNGDIELYNTYFSIENMKDNNVFNAIYNYISNVKYTNWISDEV